MSVLKEKVRKILKKATRFLMWTTGVLVLLCVALYFAIQSPTFQTWASQRVASYMSDELDTKITIGGVNVQFFTSIVLEELYVEDQHGDTLLHAPSFVVDISDFNYNEKYLDLASVTMTNANIKVKKYAGEKGLNYRFFLLYFKSNDTTTVVTKSTPWKINFGKIKLENARFAFIDTRYDDVDRGMDYENIRAREVYATFEDIEPADDSTMLYLSELRAKEQCGFEVDHMETRLIVADTFIKMNDLVIKTPGSDIKGFLSFHYDSIEDIESHFVRNVKMQGHLSESIVEMGDIAYFSPVLLGIQKRVMVTGDISGTAEKLKTRNVDLRFGKRSRIAGDFSFDGLPHIDNTDMILNFKEATTNYEDLAGIPVAPFNDSSFLNVPARIGLLGDMYFTGRIEGFVHDFVAHGKLRTAQGNLTLENLAMSQDSTEEDYNWKGILTADEFNIGTFLGVEDMGRVSGTANMVGYGTDVPSMVAAMNANFSSFEYNNYRYSNIVVTEGSLAKEVFDGKITVNDRNVHLEYKGYVDFVDPKDPKLNFTARIDSARLAVLGFADTSLNLVVSTNMYFNMHGNNIDNLEGIIRFWDVDFTKKDDKYHLDALALSADPVPEGRKLTFLSDFLTASLTGEYQLMKLPEAVTDVMTAYLPAYFPPRQVDAKTKAKEVPQHFTWTATFGRNTDVIEAFAPGIRIAPNTYFTGGFDQEKRDFNVFASSDSISIGSYEIRQVNFVKADGAGGKATLNVNIDRIQVNDTTGFDNIRLDATAGSNLLQSTIGWTNNTEKANKGKLQSDLTFESQKSFRMKINEGEFTFNDSTWTVDPTNLIRRDSSTITFTNLMFRSGEQSIGVKGRISENPVDHLDVRLDRFNLATLNFLTEASGNTVAGYISGTMVFSDMYNAPTFTTPDITFDELGLNNERLGDGTATATWFADRKGVFITTKLWRQSESDANLELSGWYYPKKEENSLDLEAKLNQMQLSLIQPVLKDYCSLVNGKIDGIVKVTGTFDRPLLNGYTDLTIRKVKVDYLGIELVQWQHAQRMKIESNAFVFDNFTISDNQGDTAVINGSLFHDNFHKFQFDMYFDFTHFMVLNTTEKMNEDYYGRVWATGFMDLWGYADQTIHMEITATTAGVVRNGNSISSDFNIPMSAASEAGSNEFIEFRDESDTSKHNDDEKKLLFNDNGLELTLNLTVNDQALVHVIFDETVGDELSARGSGTLNMHISPNGEFTMFGQYDVKEGNYLFTLKNIVYAPFELQEGGVISWNGDPADARIDVDAIYVANASVEPFFPFDSTTAAYQQTYPVNVIMHLDGQLVNPGLSFDIELPTADPGIQETVKSYTQSELEMNRQVLSLMVLNSFMTPSEFREGGEGNGVGGAGTTLLSNFVSGTLNNWLSQISENANVKFKYRPNEDMSLQELKLALGTQLLNNRLSVDIGGSVTNVNQTQSESNYNFAGDVNVEYKVTEDGKVRLRAFNRGAETNNIDNDGPQNTQGAGVFYREDFETFRELMDRYRKNLTAPNPNRKPAEPVILPQDTMPGNDSIQPPTR